MSKTFTLLVFLFLSVPLIGQREFDLGEYNFDPRKIDLKKEGIQISPSAIELKTAKLEKEKPFSAFIPADQRKKGRSAPLAFNVNYNGGAAQFPADLRDAFENGALPILSQTFTSDVPITVEVFSINTNPNALAGALPADAVPFTLFPCAECWYPIALAEKMVGININEDEPDVFVIVNPNFPWYYDYQNPQLIGGRTDFVTVILHEMIHGLGFAGGATVDSTGLGSLREFDRPWIFDISLTNNGQKVIEAVADPSTSLGNVFTSESLFYNNNLFGDTTSFRLYAPSEFIPGSSIHHLDELTYSNIEEGNALMTPFIGEGGTVIQDPGQIVDTLMDDLGWFSTTIFPENPPPFDTSFSVDAEVPVTISIRTDEDLDLSTLALVFAAESEDFRNLYEVPFSADPGGETYTAILPAPQVEETFATFYGVFTTSGKLITSPGLTLDGLQIPIFYDYGNVSSLSPSLSREADLNLFPNPVKDLPLQIELKLTGNARAVSYQILDPLGRTLRHRPLPGLQNTLREQMETDGLSPGLHTVRFLLNDGTIVRERFIVSE